MPINITHSVIHGFNKEQQGPVTHIIKRPILLDVELPAVKDLVSGLAVLLGKRTNSQAWGRFGNDGRQGLFPENFLEYTDKLEDAGAFNALTHLGKR